MRGPIIRLATPAWGLGAVLLLSACGDPCRDLSQKICACRDTPQLRKECTDQVQARASQRQPEVSEAAERAGREVCASLIDGCTCAALRAGNRQACGLSSEPASD